MIPAILHQVWDGAIPERIQKLRDSFPRYNPAWKFMLWDYASVAGRFPDLAAYIGDPAISPVVKSDIVRFRALDALGGFYADTDCECLRNLDPLRGGRDFVIGWESEVHIPALKRRPFAGGHFAGSVAGNPIVRDCANFILDNVRRRYHAPLAKTEGAFQPFANMWEQLECSGPYAVQTIIEKWKVRPLPVNCFSPCAYKPRPSTEALLSLPGPAYVFHRFDGMWPGGWTKQFTK